MKLLRCKLPEGFTDSDGTLHRDAELNLLTGKDEEFLVHHIEEETAPVSLIDQILARCLNRLGDISSVPPGVVEALSDPDRLYLLLKIYINTFGDRVQDRVSCPGSGCGEPIDIDFSILDLIRGGVLEGKTGVELELEVHCPECGEVFDFPFHPPGFFLDRLKVGLPELYREVHALAFHYHWSEGEILAMPRQKRRMYLDILDHQLERLNDGETSAYEGFPTGNSMNTIPGWGSLQENGQNERKRQRGDKLENENSSQVQEPFTLLEETLFPADEGGVTIAKTDEFTEVTEIRLPGVVESLPPEKGEEKGDSLEIREIRQENRKPVKGDSLEIPEEDKVEKREKRDRLEIHEIHESYKTNDNRSQYPLKDKQSQKSQNGQNEQKRQKGDRLENDEPPQTIPTVPEPVFSSSSPPVPDAFWARSYLGRFHLKTLR